MSDSEKKSESKLSLSRLAAENGGPAKPEAAAGSSEEPGRLNLSGLSGNSGDGSSGHSSDNAGVRSESGREDVLYRETAVRLARIFEAARRGEVFSTDPARDSARQLIDSLNRSGDLLQLAIHRDYKKDPVIYHSFNVAVLSLRMGIDLGLDSSGLEALGLTALLHDIGTSRVPDDIFYKPAKLTDKELRQVRQRPLFTREILSGVNGEKSGLPVVAFQVYERLDGSGYPLGLKGREIHPHAQIIGLADFYEALVHSRPHRGRFLYFPAIREILRSGKHAFDRRYLKALINTVSVFPVASCVRLNSGAIGRVLESYSQYPLRPRIMLLYDSQERPVLKESIVELKDNPLLFITEAVAQDTADALAAPGT